MSACENVAAATFAFPGNSMPVADRRMTLTIQCREPAEYTSTFRGLGAGRKRDGAQVRAFGLCDNHRRVLEQIDVELVQDAWSPAQAAGAVPLA